MCGGVCRGELTARPTAAFLPPPCGSRCVRLALLGRGLGPPLVLTPPSPPKLGDVSSYKILSQSGCTTLEGVDDAKEFRDVKAAFDTIGMDGESQAQVWKLLASVLHMSNLEFDKVDDAQGEIASITDREVSQCQDAKQLSTLLPVLQQFGQWLRVSAAGQGSLRTGVVFQNDPSRFCESSGHLFREAEALEPSVHDRSAVT